MPWLTYEQNMAIAVQQANTVEGGLHTGSFARDEKNNIR
jgi:hypothetical protein